MLSEAEGKEKKPWDQNIVENQGSDVNAASVM